MSDLIIAAVPITLIEVVWPQVMPLFKLVEDKSPEDTSQIETKRRILEGDELLITVSEGSKIVAFNVMTVITTDAGTRCLYIPITGGTRMSEWAERFLSIAKVIAKEHNCTQLRGLACRDGWLRYLKKFGWSEVFTTIKCDIEG
tara:strand:- start:16652 stop:17083 length:432 start_codon:yes stop_codon:yes gene_type:complete